MNKSQFGTGVLFGDPVAGNLAANPTPYRFGVMQEATMDHKGSNEKLYGQMQYAVDIARGPIDVSVKSKLAVVDIGMWNQLALGQASSTGFVQIADSEAHAALVPAQPAAHATGTAYLVGALIWDGDNVQKCVTPGNSAAGAPAAWGTVVGAETADGQVVWQCMGPNYGNVAVTNAATFSHDYGVRYGNGAGTLQKVPGAPAAGQYACDGAGNYTFSAADAGQQVLISYSYSVATGTTIALANQLLGSAPKFRAFLYNTYDGAFFGVELYRCVVSDISLPTKQNGFWICDFNFDACCDPSESLGRLLSS
jgi:hypothetical protein